MGEPCLVTLHTRSAETESLVFVGRAKFFLRKSVVTREGVTVDSSTWV